MLEHISDPAGRLPRPVQGPAATPARPSAKGASEGPRGPAFEALLEKLEAQARELQDRSRSVERPADLAEAVGRAHDSLEAALSVRDQLLEAFRERLQGSGADPAPQGGGTGSGTGDGPGAGGGVR
jgi:flagellar hook-basal body complex protein FliE